MSTDSTRSNERMKSGTHQPGAEQQRSKNEGLAASTPRSSLGNIESATTWRAGRWHGELSDDGDSIYFVVESTDEKDCRTRLATYTAEAKFRELCAMFGVSDEILPNSDKGEPA